MGSPDLHGFQKWVFDSFVFVNDFTWQVVVSRREARVRKWTDWLREDLGSGPYAWLRRDFVPPSPILAVKAISLSLGSPVWLFCWSWLSPLVFGLRVSWMLVLP